MFAFFLCLIDRLVDIWGFYLTFFFEFAGQWLDLYIHFMAH